MDKRYAQVLAWTSIVLGSVFWFALALHRISNSFSVQLPNYIWRDIAGAAVILALGAAVARSRLAVFALPYSLGTFLLIMYVIGS